MPSNVQHASFTAWTTRVSNPVCSPRFRASASGMVQMAAFAPVFFPISTNFTSTLGIPPSSPTLKPASYRAPFPGLAQAFHARRIRPPTRPLRPVNPNNASPLRITAAAGTKLAGASSAGTVIIVPAKRALQPEGLHHPRGIAGSGFPPLSNIPYCCLP